MSTLVYELAVVEDHGSHWAVTNVTKNSLDNLANRDEKYLKLSYVAYKTISDALMAGKQVTITKSLMTDEVLPFEVTITDVGNSIDPLLAAKNATIAKVRMLVTPELSKIAGLALYAFIVLNNDLAAKGFFITDENREEMYLKILETGDESLIQKLEDYLNHRDEIDRVSQLERKFSAFNAKIRDARVVDDVVELEQRFLTDFYATF